MLITLEDLKNAGAKIVGHPTVTSYDNSTIDSRRVTPKSLFFALKGTKGDGHDYVKSATENGASLCVVEREVSELSYYALVENVEAFMAHLAHQLRQRIKSPVIGITGSSGKTTTKEYLKHVLSAFGSVEATQGNLNNHLGVPLTLFNFSDDQDFYIIEMGMSALREIAFLTKICEPHIGIITSVGRAHLEGVGGTLAHVAQAKGELFENLKPERFALVNEDDHWIKGMNTPAQTIKYGFSDSASLRATNYRVENHSAFFDLIYQDKVYCVELPAVGRHHVINSLAVLSVCVALHLDITKAIATLSKFKLPDNRGGIWQWNNTLLIDDSYNANPDSMLASLKSLRESYPNHYPIAVLGGMNELGQNSPELHYEVGQACSDFGYSALLCMGTYAGQYVRGANENKKQDLFMAHEFSDYKSLGMELINLVSNHSQSVVLLKGSRGWKMESVIEFLLAQGQSIVKL